MFFISMEFSKEYENPKKRVLKRSKTGMETEFHLIDLDGNISNKSLSIINKLKQAYPEVNVVKEVSQNIIEFGCYPDVKTYNPTLDMIHSIEKAIEILKKDNVLIYPFSTYPGKFESKLSDGNKYELQQKIFGKERFDIAGRVTGFHHHYGLPKGVFDYEKRKIKTLRRSKLARSLVSSYNFEIAADPALTLFTQSSPFYQGQHFAKDSRMLVYRGGKKLKYMDGLYANHQQIGALPPYKQTTTDLLSSLYKRWKRWDQSIKKVDPSLDINEIYPNKLDITWNPVKINKHGTLEQRGMSINNMSIVVATTVLLKFSLKAIQQNFLEIIPADFAIDEPFKVENNILYVPPHSYVRGKLQPWSAYDGYNNKAMAEYAKRFYNFARSVTPKKYNHIIKPICGMIENKKSMSDKILGYAKKQDYLRFDTISDEDASKLAVYYAEKFPKDLENTKKELEKISV